MNDTDTTGAKAPDSGDCAAVADGPPGRPLPSGFDYRPASEHPELMLSDEARQRVLDAWHEHDAKVGYVSSWQGRS